MSNLFEKPPDHIKGFKMQEVVNVKPQPVPQPKHISIVIENIGKQYKRGSNTVKVLSELNLQVPKGEFLALMGPSGSGKSTLLNLIGGIDRPTMERLASMVCNSIV